MKLSKLTLLDLFWWTLLIAIALALLWYRSEIVQHFAEMEEEERNSLLMETFISEFGLQLIGLLLVIAAVSIASAIDYVRHIYSWMTSGAKTLLRISNCSRLRGLDTITVRPDKPCEPSSFVIYPTDASGSPVSDAVTYHFGVNLLPSRYWQAVNS